ncbi:MAG: hypothetical protein Q7R39_07080, partial [Dehalococcoidia bacterium]|nr:hypothetical protein [Dehalococcoidia bacterium]
HHQLTTAWSVSGYWHHASSSEGGLDSERSVAAGDAGSDVGLCLHKDSSADAPMADASVDISASAVPSFTLADRAGAGLLATALRIPQGLSFAPPERPPLPTG